VEGLQEGEEVQTDCLLWRSHHHRLIYATTDRWLLSCSDTVESSSVRTETRLPATHKSHHLYPSLFQFKRSSSELSEIEA